MAEQAKSTVVISDFKGIATAIDRNDAPPGLMVDQVNAAIQDTGALTVRGGYKEVKFDN